MTTLVSHASKVDAVLAFLVDDRQTKLVVLGSPSTGKNDAIAEAIDLSSAEVLVWRADGEMSLKRPSNDEGIVCAPLKVIVTRWEEDDLVRALRREWPDSVQATFVAETVPGGWC
jgi:hypothetical protein